METGKSDPMQMMFRDLLFDILGRKGVHVTVATLEKIQLADKPTFDDLVEHGLGDSLLAMCDTATFHELKIATNILNLEMPDEFWGSLFEILAKHLEKRPSKSIEEVVKDCVDTVISVSDDECVHKQMCRWILEKEFPEIEDAMTKTVVQLEASPSEKHEMWDGITWKELP